MPNPARADQTAAELEMMARSLEASDNFRVVRRLHPPTQYATGAPVGELRQGLLVDLETTGLDTSRDAIIEFGAVPFRFDSSGQTFQLLEPLVYLEDPGRPIPPEVQALTRITDDDVRGKRIDDERVNALIETSALVIAHNAYFDRRMVERRLPNFAAKHWGCSKDDVPWPHFGCSSLKLDYLLYDVCRVFHDGHRAVDDCYATLHLLSHPRDADGRTPLSFLLENARKRTHRVWARKSPFDTKDALKARGYRWHDASKTWYIDRESSALDGEQEWLRAHVYRASATPHTEVTTFTAKDRYSDRVQ